MKKLAKMLAAASVLALLSFGFFGCSEDDDDENEMIEGSNKNYSINFTNDTGATSRGWNTTTFKHLGELVKITINNQTSSSQDGVMGFVWDLRQSKSVTGAAITDEGYQNFFLVGVGNYNGKIRYYISKFFNVTNLLDSNFGAPTNDNDTVTTHEAGIAKTTPVELRIKGGASSETFPEVPNASISDGAVTVWIDIYPVYDGSTYGVNKSEHSSDTAGSYVVDIYTADPTAADFSGKPAVSETIAPEKTGYSAKPSQGTLAVYANVYQDKTLSGEWYLAKDYAEAEVIEDAE